MKEKNLQKKLSKIDGFLRLFRKQGQNKKKCMGKH